jgi:DNA-directed RNA polymerase specialized sigma24 family protein
VTVNRAVDFCRRRLFVVGAFDRPEEQRRAAIEVGDEEVFRRDVAAAFEALTEAQRSVLVGKVFDGMTFAEIAAEHDSAVSTVKTHYVRAVRAVRDRLAPCWGDETR